MLLFSKQCNGTAMLWNIQSISNTMLMMDLYSVLMLKFSFYISSCIPFKQLFRFIQPGWSFFPFFEVSLINAYDFLSPISMNFTPTELLFHIIYIFIAENNGAILIFSCHVYYAFHAHFARFRHYHILSYFLFFFGWNILRMWVWWPEIYKLSTSSYDGFVKVHVLSTAT